MKKITSTRTRSRIARAAVESLENRQLLTASSTPFFPTPLGVNQVIPATAYDKGGEGVAYHDTTPTNLGNDPTYRPNDAVDISTGGTTGTIVNNTAVGEYLMYTLKVPTSGNYILSANVANTANGATFNTLLNGKNLAGAYTVPDTGSFTKFKTVSSNPFALSAGTIKMEILIASVATNTAGGNFDSFQLVPSPPPAPTTDKPYPSQIFLTNQAIPLAQFDRGGEGVSYHDTTSVNLGNDSFRDPESVDISSGGTTGNIVGFTAAGEWLNYTVYVKTAGTYDLSASAANPVGGALFHAQIGTTNLTGPIVVASTADFKTFATDTSGVFKLSGGYNIIRIVFDSAASNGAIGNFDTFKIAPAAPPVEAPFTTPFATNTVIPAANYDKGGEGLAYHDTTPANLGNDNYRPGDGVDISTGGTTKNIVGFTAAGEYLNYTLNVATAGMYTLQAATANAAAGASFHAEVAGVNLTGAIAVGNTAAFTTFATDTSTPFALTAGTHVLHVVFDKAATNGAIGNFDYFKIVPYVAPKDTPFKSAFTANTTIPAANFDNGGQGVSYNDTTPTNLGNDNYRPGTAVDISTGGTTKNIVGFTAAGEYLNYTVNVATAGTYELQASTANAAAGATFHVEVAGVNLSGAIAVANTGSFTTYATDTSTPFTLAAGTQVLHVVFDKGATNGAIGNFDFFKLVPFTAPKDTPFKSAFAVNTTIPAANFDNGGQGVSYNDTTATNLGNDTFRTGTGVDLKTGGTTGNLVAYTAAGEWLQYTVTVAKAGNYKLQASVANPGTGASFQVEVAGVNLSGPIAITPTADFNTFATDTSASFKLAAGTQIIRVFFDTAANNGAVGNFDFFKLIAG